MEKNEYFEEMYRVYGAYDDAKEERMKEREALKAADDWDAVRAFDKREEKEFPRPYTRGESDAFRAYRENLYNQNDEFFEVKELPWEQDMANFVKALRNAGIKTILITDQSTALMESLFSLTENGCSMGALKTYKRIERRWGEDEEILIHGIEFEIA